MDFPRAGGRTYLNWSMCETSKREAFVRVCVWEATMPWSAYWTGMSQPAKGTSLPPCFTWKA